MSVQAILITLVNVVVLILNIAIFLANTYTESIEQELEEETEPEIIPDPVIEEATGNSLFEKIGTTAKDGATESSRKVRRQAKQNKEVDTF